MNVVIEPSALFISEIEWADESTRDDFLNNLMEILGFIDEKEEMNIYWNDEYEELMWMAPQKAPWRSDRDFSNQLVPILYKKLGQNRKDINDSLRYNECLFEPLDYFDGAEVESLFLKMMHYCIFLNEKIYMVTKDCYGEGIFFFCDCHSYKLSPKVVVNAKGMLNEEQLIEELWPRSKNQIHQFERLIIMLSQMRNIEKFIYSYEFTSEFIGDIINKHVRRSKLVEQLIKRLTMTNAEARGDASLQDEVVKGSKERRMRITQQPTSTRVHYIYTENKLKFINYYCDGEHDLGLR